MRPSYHRAMRSVAMRLVAQSQDAALTAVQVFNNPMVRFKSENFIVLMHIAWTYLLHAHYRQAGVEYRYHRGTGKGRRYDRTADGSFKYWDLRRCLGAAMCPLDNETQKNLLFLIGLRDEITHHMSPVLDQYVSARYQACCINYNHYIKQLFGPQHGIDQHLTYSLQFSQISRQQLSSPSETDLPASVRSYIARFDSGLTTDEINSDRFAFRMLFIPKLVGKAGQADEVIEFFRADSEIAKAVNRDYVAFKEVERPKFLPKKIVSIMQQEGYAKFNMHHHTQLWKSLDVKEDGRGFGVPIAGAWYWYQSWIDIVRDYCKENAARFR